MDWTIWMFLTVALIVFGIAAAALGVFSAYFGKGKNRTYGLIVAAVGVIVLVAWVWLVLWSDISPFCDVNLYETLLDTVYQLVAVLIGVLVAAGIFLVTVLKS